MFSRRNLSLLGVLLLLSLIHVAHCAKTVSTPAQREARHQQRRLQNNDKGNGGKEMDDNDIDDNDNDDNDNEKDAANNKDTANKAGNGATTAPPPTMLPTPLPTIRPTPLTTTVATPVPTTLPPSPTNPPTAAPSTPPPTLGSSPTSVTHVSAEQLREIQYFGGAEVTLRVSVWFQDGTSATQVMGTNVEEAVLEALHSLLCQSETPLAEAMASESLGFSTLFEDNSNVDTTRNNNNPADQENRQLCVVNTDLHGSSLFPSDSTVEGSVLFQPPTTIVIDGTHSGTDLKWTTWTVTWDILRLGTFYILQGLENAGADAVTLTTEQMYLAGIRAMQGVVELALQVSIRELSFDKLMVAEMGVAGRENSLVLTSVYGEEVETFQPKLEWLGLALATTSPATSSTQQGEQGADTNIVYPSETVDNEPSTTSDAQVGETVDNKEDDVYDDDRYSLEYGITEPIDPPFWHALRIVGIVMFILTTASIVGLSCMSKKRQTRRERDREMTKEGLLNNPQGVEDMLRASVSRRHPTDTTPELAIKTYTKSEDEEGFAIPTPKTLRMN